MTYSVVLMCQTVVDLHAKHVGRGGGQRGWLNFHVQHPDRQCSRQQNYVLAVHAIIHSCNTTINRCGAGWGGFEGAGSWAIRVLGGGGSTMGLEGGRLKIVFKCEHNLLQFSGILCMVMILLQAAVL